MEAPLVRSVIVAFGTKLELIRVAVCPGGQLRVVAGRDTVRLPTMFPLLLAVNWPLAVTVAAVVVFFGSAGTFPPLLTHESSLDAKTEIWTVSTEPDARPVSLKEHTRVRPTSLHSVALRMKWGLPAAANGSPTSTRLDEFSLHAIANTSTAMGIRRLARIKISSEG
jgi:hypothetical protein